ncbi:MAG: tyrosine-protein phosphatase [Caldilineaceae bacterium]
MSNCQQPATRHLNWEACYNARDLGGLPTLDGGQTRWQAVIRSDLLNRLTALGQRALLDYGVRTIIDLRGPKEVAEEPSPFAAATEKTGALTYLHLPLERYEPQVSALITQATTRAEVYCIVLDHYPDMVATVMQAIAQARPGGIVVHCHSGKDRTGTVAALLLHLAGVSSEAIAADYAESQARLWPLYEKRIAEAGGEDKVDFWLKPTATAEMMHTTLAHLDHTYGGVRNYLLTVGLSPAELQQLQDRLR